ncbi:MAG: Mur ligase family protein [Candidatus Magasanikbacteria bacterium]|nr:Mur ligase family protein [Candidatus Magasanikbacteria bacterium]
MTYAEAYNFILSLNNLPRREYISDPRHSGVYLERMRVLLKILGNPEKKIPHFAHVTGTSGKGSVARLLAAGLIESGKRVGLVTSPHPSTMQERWEINGRAMAKNEFNALVSKLKPALEKFLEISRHDVPSFSEIMTMLGIMYFAKHKVDFAVLEVACGGRYDATNIIPRKDIAIITNIGLDHVDIIGPTKKDIAYEKAGIIKRGARVFTAEKDKKLVKIFEREIRRAGARSLTRISQAGVKVLSSDSQGSSFIIDGQKYTLPVAGEHQINNALIARAALKSAGVTEPEIIKAFQNIVLPVCFEVVARNPLIILDGAHNPDKMRSTVTTLKKLVAQENIGSLHLVAGFAANKDIKNMIRQLATLNPQTIAATRFTSNTFRKAADPRFIAEKFKNNLKKNKNKKNNFFNGLIKTFLEPAEALAWSKAEQKKTRGLLLATGSIFLSGQLRPYFKRR